MAVLILSWIRVKGATPAAGIILYTNKHQPPGLTDFFHVFREQPIIRANQIEHAFVAEKVMICPIYI